MPGVLAPSLITRQAYCPLGIGPPPSAASGSRSAPSRAISAACPDLRAASSALANASRQSRRRLRSASVATWRQSRLHSGIIPTDWRTVLQPASTTASDSKRAERIELSLGGSPPSVHAEVCPRDRRSIVTAQEQGEGGDLFGRDECLGRLGGEQNVIHDLLPRQATGFHCVWDLVLHQLSPDVPR